MFSKEKQKFVRSLHDKKTREETGYFLVEGGKNIIEFLEYITSFVIPSQKKAPFQDIVSAPPLLKELFISEKFLQENTGLLKHFSYEIGTLEEIGKCSTLVKNDDAIAIIQKPVTPVFVENPTTWTLVLDTINDPGNLGTILRIADWYGIKKIICSKETVEIYNPKVIVASMGSWMRVQTFYTSISETLNNTKLPIYGAFLGGENVHTTDFSAPWYIIIGSESHGINKLIEWLVTNKITIPRIGEAESLNAGIATGIILDNIFRKI